MIWGDDPETITDADWHKLLHTPPLSPVQAEPSPVTKAAGRPGERPCYTAPQARTIYLHGFALGALIGFAANTVFVCLVWQLTR